MLRFTIRDVLWLTVVVAITVSWWVDHRWLTGDRLAFQHYAMQEVLRNEGWIVESGNKWHDVRINKPGNKEKDSEWGPSQ